MEAINPSLPLEDDIEDDLIPLVVISHRQFIILCIASLGLYQIWWIYKSWKFFQDREGLKIHAAIRTVLSIIFLVPLFRKILHFGKTNGYSGDYLPVPLFVGFLIANSLSQLPGFWALLSFTSILFLIPPFTALKFGMENSPDYRTTEQTSFSGRQLAVIIIGCVLWFFLLIGLWADDLPME